MSNEAEEFSSEQLAEASLNARKRVSIVWRYFEKLDRLRVRCKLCRHVQNYQGTTGNILRHLKNKHNIDATLKGQQTNPDLLAKLMADTSDREPNEDDLDDIDVKTETFTPMRQTRDVKCKTTSFNEDLDDPYTEATILDDYIDNNKGSKNLIQNGSGKQKYTVDEERIIAEIEYFREKAAYYRMQKNLVALQAKKVKYELDQLL